MDYEIYIRHTDWEGICYFENNKIYRKNITTEYGNYNLNKNILTIYWENWSSEIFIKDNNYIYYLSKKYNNIIYNKNISDNISNISLCNKNIIISLSPYAIKDTLNINLLNNTIINKNIYCNNDFYEASYTIIIELLNYSESIIINIDNYSIYLEQLNIKKHNISAMTLFKDDYNLLKRYLKYYSNLGVDVFFVYYNNEINDNIIKLINENNNYNIYLIEWNYKYWHSKDQHNAQTMAINDSLHILKNYGNYTLYNDLDEFIILDDYNNFNDMISLNDDIDIFQFKNRFCKMGNELIKYEDFDNVFDLSKIIKGNYWDKYREKLLINLNKINIMGIHKVFNYKSNNTKYISEFYHIINFKEKYREDLMTEWIT